MLLFWNSIFTGWAYPVFRRRNCARAVRVVTTRRRARDVRRQWKWRGSCMELQRRMELPMLSTWVKKTWRHLVPPPRGCTPVHLHWCNCHSASHNIHSAWCCTMDRNSTHIWRNMLSAIFILAKIWRRSIKRVGLKLKILVVIEV